MISSSEREPLSKLRRATRATSGFFKQREQRDPSTRAHAARKHLAKCGVDLEPTSSFGAQLTARTARPINGAHAARKHLDTTSHSFPTLPRAYRSPPKLRAVLRAHAHAQPHHLSFSTHRYRSAEAGHLGLRARVGPAGTQPPHAQEPCPRKIHRRRRNGASTSIFLQRKRKR